MKLRISGLLMIAALALASVLGSTQSVAQNAYITNSGSNTVSVINTATNTVTATIPVGSFPLGVAVTPDGSKVYVANRNDDSVSVIDTATNTVTATIPVGNAPFGVAVTPDGSKVYVTNSVIATATNTVIATIPFPMNTMPSGLAVTPDGSKVYVTVAGSCLPDGPRSTFSVIATPTNTVTALFEMNCEVLAAGVAVTPDGSKVYVVEGASSELLVFDTATNTPGSCCGSLVEPFAVAVSPDGSRIYVTNGPGRFNTVLVFDTATNTVIATIPVAGLPFGVAVTPDGSKVYVANRNDDSVSVIDTATNTVTATIPVGNGPVALGNFIQPAPRFAGTPGFSNCYGQSVSALAQQFGGLNAAAVALGFSRVPALRDAILAFCGG